MRALSPEQWAQLVAEYESSNEVPQKEFVARHDVSINTFRFWLYKLRQQKKSHHDSATRFLPVEVVASPAPKARGGGDAVELQLRSGATLRFEVGTDPRYLAALIAALG